jgi:ADP-ribose pyrophosphatase YjhB (NUDIX family)
MSRTARCQGAILRERQILLIQHKNHGDGRSYWLLPGGGMEPGEAPEDTTRREMKEETGLDVCVERLLLDQPNDSFGGIYTHYLTFLCTSLSGEAQPGYEPEPEVSAIYAINAVAWFDLWDETTWNDSIRADRITYPLLKEIQKALGIA